MIRLLTATIGYLCVATVITAIALFGYLKSSGMINDEKLFQIWAVVHEIDVEALISDVQAVEDGTPGEETSYEDMRWARHVKLRDFELKEQLLSTLSGEMNHVLKLVADEMSRRDLVMKDFEQRLNKASNLALEQGNSQIARQWKQMKDDAIKDVILRMIGEDQLEDVVVLLEQMPDNKLKKILAQFRSEQELDEVHRIQDLLRAGFPVKKEIDDVREKINQLNDT